MKPGPEPGSITEVTARLQLWCTRPDHGLIRITFDDAEARVAAMRAEVGLGPV
jgi:hypothetical protein